VHLVSKKPNAKVRSGAAGVKQRPLQTVGQPHMALSPAELHILRAYQRVGAMALLDQLTIGVGDRYRVERELGHGGMAVVFLATDLKHRRQVALKVLKPELSVALGSERFLREIEIAAALQHPHILPLYDSGQVVLGGAHSPLGEAAGSLLYYVMPYVEGESLRERLRREGQLPLDAALRIAQEVGSALQYANDHGVVHRDVKPENVMLSAGQAVVTDFGIARAIQAAGTESLTLSGIVVGTPQYMSPEQACGGAVDGRSDQYSLACTLYEMLVAEPPFTGPSVQAVIARHSVEPVPSLRVVRQTVPPEMEAAIVRAMAKSPADRFPSIRQFLDALAPSPVSSATTLPRAATGRPALWRRVAAVLVGALLLAGAGWWFLAGRSTIRGAPGAPVTSIAVLPFRELEASPDSSYLGDGMTEGLIVDLSQIGSLKIISRSSGAMAQGTGLPLAGRAGELGVQALVEGSIGRTGDSVRIGVRLVRAADSTPLLDRSWAGRLGELPNLQREITVAITGAIGAKLGSERGRLEVRRGEVDQRAYDAYLRGRFELERGELEQAKASFEQAGRLAPQWAPPLVGLANYYTTLPFATDVAPAEVLPRARAALAEALERDETLAEAHAANAYIRAYYDWDWRGAEREFRRAIELRSSYADAYFSYSRFLASRRRLDEAIAQLGRAIELDPLALSVQANLALLHYFAGRYDEAETRLRAVLRRDSTDVTAIWGLALVAEQEGRPRDAIALLKPISGASNNRKASLGHAYAIAGRAADARKVLAELQAAAAKSYVPSYWFALVYAGLGRRDEALRALERAYEERSTVLAYLLIDPRLAALRQEPRYVALARRLSGDDPGAP
jgi:eukaryotic-like serine/threonine-protein kinase